MEAQRLSVSFEVVARCLGQHGQLPHGEYLVTTSIARLTSDARIEVRQGGESHCTYAAPVKPLLQARPPQTLLCPQVLPWADALRFCAAHHLPTNDVWLFATRATAAAARQALDEMAVAGEATAAVQDRLDALVAQSAASLRLPGSYPHHVWQGDRLEGFVVSQGDVVESDGALAALAESLQTLVVRSSSPLDHSRPLRLSAMDSALTHA